LPGGTFCSTDGFWEEGGAEPTRRRIILEGLRGRRKKGGRKKKVLYKQTGRTQYNKKMEAGKGFSPKNNTDHQKKTQEKKRGAKKKEI